jgi:hypothetical protein
MSEQHRTGHLCDVGVHLVRVVALGTRLADEIKHSIGLLTRA